MPSLPQQYTTNVTEDADGSNTTTTEYWGPSSQLDPLGLQALVGTVTSTGTS